MNEIKNVIFDLGRVLIDWEPQKIALELAEANPAFNPQIFKITQTPFWYLFDLGYINSAELIEHFSNEFSRENLNIFFQKAMESLVPLNLGMNLLQAVRERGFATYVLSNMSFEFYQWISSQYSILEGFHGAVFSYEIHTMKPDFKIYQYLLDKYSLKPQECLFIDDMDCNIFSARKVGINSLLYQPQDDMFSHLRKLNIL